MKKIVLFYISAGVIALIAIGFFMYVPGDNQFKNIVYEISNQIQNKQTEESVNQNNYMPGEKPNNNPVPTSSRLELTITAYHTACQMKDCKPNYAPETTQYLTLNNGDSFGASGTTGGSNSGPLFELVSFDENIIVVKPVSFISPLVNRKIVAKDSNSNFTFHSQACFTVNNMLDNVASYCLSRTSLHADLNFDVISRVAP